MYKILLWSQHKKSLTLLKTSDETIRNIDSYERRLKIVLACTVPTFLIQRRQLELHKLTLSTVSTYISVFLEIINEGLIFYAQPFDAPRRPVVHVEMYLFL